MNNRILTGISFLIFGLLIAVVPHYIFPVCTGHIETAAGGSVPMKCHWTAMAELGIGIMIALGGLSMLLSANWAYRSGVNTMLLFAGVLAMAVPTILIGVCKTPTMPCHSGTLPALIILSSIVIILALINMFYLSKKMA